VKTEVSIVVRFTHEGRLDALFGAAGRIVTDRKDPDESTAWRYNPMARS
jgi:hypothetical protein